MSKNISENHDSHGGGATMTPQEASEKLGEDAFNKLKDYKENPNAETYFHYRDVQAQFGALVTGEKYVKPRKHHDLAMADIYMRHNQTRSMNFYVGVLSRFKRKCSWTIPTMQVGVDKASFYFGYHPEFYKYYPIDFCVWALSHEAHHILQDHIPRLIKIYNAMKPTNPDKPTAAEMADIKQLQTYTNIAADEAVNSLLQHDGKHHHVDRTGFINHEDYGHEALWSYEEYLNSWLLDPYTLFNKKNGNGEGEGEDGSGEGEEGSGSGSGSGHSSMEEAISGKGSGEGEKSEGGEGSGSGSPKSIEDKAQQDFNDTTGSNGHSWLDDIRSGKSSVPSEEEMGKVKDAQEEGIAKGVLKDGEPSTSELNDLADILSKQAERVLIETTRDHIHRGGRGTVPGHYLEKYEQLIEASAQSWTDIFESMVSDPKEAKETYRINKLNRNNLLMGKTCQYGFKEDDPKYHIWFSVDTSYSMNKTDLEEGIASLFGIMKSDSEITVTLCEFDTSIHRIRTLDADQTDVVTDMQGRGGTDFNCTFRHISELPEQEMPDLHIIFTDGGAPPPLEEVRIPTTKMPLLWVLTSTRPDMWFEDNYGDILHTES